MQSSAKFMKHMLCSQMSSVKHSMNLLVLKFERLDQRIDELFEDFLKPYQA